ncbi:ArsR/SmtB family transcription factor [Actinophytocola algeriensis]|uniref:DNA-binding transcriptional ArsR family regulator n=1 Tax=Actinophytocola algeriensis TaxID=1768010 RepID=A0A7W7QCD8_9PSEU|nr:helix-turn-helix domain-containing protein [Actinophytocola algeriensis]MBB4911057.1 DNA-binding transcriptional ArsR family regulator [Actinophytocola algeriensis]MBE1474050.1 DNA-binding transcriptional ArsR family regulator [Actinophytocola algeriensis]
MTLLRFGPDALHVSRFAVSPLAETLSELTRLRQTRAGVLAGRLDEDPFVRGLVDLVTATKYLPDFVAIPPGRDLADELAAMRRIGDAEARATLVEAHRFAWASDGLAWADVTGITGRAADFLAECWTRFVEPDWTRRRAIMERDIHHRAGVIAVSGWRHALDGMAPDVEWAGHDAIRFSTQTYPDRHIGSDGLTFVPHTGMSGRWICETPTRIAFVYPAKGALADHSLGDAGVARLLGLGRARVVAEVRMPATPSQLAAVLGVSLGTVSAHLAALRAADVVTARRSGRAVYYELTPVGEELARLVTRH